MDICGAVVKRELDYWKIDGALIEPCCWTNYSSYINKQKTLSDFNKSMIEEDNMIKELRNVSGWKKKQMAVWMVLDHPRSSRLAMVSNHFVCWFYGYMFHCVSSIHIFNISCVLTVTPLLAIVIFNPVPAPP